MTPADDTPPDRRPPADAGAGRAAATAELGDGDPERNERRRRILSRNSGLVLIGYAITQLAALAARLLGLSSVHFGEIVFVTVFTMASTLVFYAALRLRKTVSTRYARLFQMGQYLTWLVAYAIWVVTLREIRVMALFCAMMALTFMLSDTKASKSLGIALGAFLIQILASWYAIHGLGQPGVFKLEVYYAFCFAPAALFLTYLSGLFSRQRLEVKRVKRGAEDSRDALAIEVARSRRANAELAQAMQTIEAMARMDSLTGLSNRRHLMESLELARKRHARTRLPFSVIVVDIDHFKNINDSFGHPQGDAVLRELARLLQSTLRDCDLCARYGGEEFMLLLEKAGAEEAARCGERVRGLVEKQKFAGLPPGFSVTISLGIAQFAEGESVDQCIARADAALYRAKRGGRNRWELAALLAAEPAS